MNLSTLQSILNKQITELDHTVSLCLSRLARRQEFVHSGAEDILADSMASCLHSFYTGLESLLESIAVELDELPKGSQWHKTLLTVMTVAAPGIRPAVLSEESRAMLDEFRSFRHLFRNLYAHSLRPQRVFELAGALDATWRITRRDLVTFLEFLEGVDGTAAA